jgi:hypothetical protein
MRGLVALKDPAVLAARLVLVVRMAVTGAMGNRVSLESLGSLEKMVNPGRLVRTENLVLLVPKVRAALLGRRGHGVKTAKM